MTVDVKYVGFDIPDEFVVGYGLDYAERYRNLRSVSHARPARLRLTTTRPAWTAGGRCGQSRVVRPAHGETRARTAGRGR